MNQTIAKKNSTSVPIAGWSDKRNISGTFIINLDGRILSMQLTYGWKSCKASRNLNFWIYFHSVLILNFSKLLNFNKVTTEIVAPYVENQRQQVQKQNQAALLIMDVFRGQETEDVISLLQQYNILLVLIPNNLTLIFQPFKLTVRKYWKPFLKKLSSEWYSKQTENKLSFGRCWNSHKWLESI